MKKFLISESEKRRILNMHNNYRNRHESWVINEGFSASPGDGYGGDVEACKKDLPYNVAVKTGQISSYAQWKQLRQDWGSDGSIAQNIKMRDDMCNGWRSGDSNEGVDGDMEMDNVNGDMVAVKKSEIMKLLNDIENDDMYSYAEEEDKQTISDAKNKINTITSENVCSQENLTYYDQSINELNEKKEKPNTKTYAPNISKNMGEIANKLEEIKLFCSSQKENESSSPENSEIEYEDVDLGGNSEEQGNSAMEDILVSKKQEIKDLIEEIENDGMYSAADPDDQKLVEESKNKIETITLENVCSSENLTYYNDSIAKLNETRKKQKIKMFAPNIGNNMGKLVEKLEEIKTFCSTQMTESYISRIVRRVLREQYEEEKMQTLPVQEIPSNLPNTINSDIEDLYKKRDELSQEFITLERSSGRLMGRLKNKVGDKMGELEDSAKEEIERIRVNILMKLDDIKRKFQYLRLVARKRKEEKNKKQDIERLEKDIEKLEKSIDQIKNKKVVTAIDLQNLKNILSISGMYMTMIGSIIARFIYMAKEDQPKPSWNQ